MKQAPNNAYIIGTGSYVPEKVLTNADLEKMVETSDEWITTRTGIKERRIAEDGVATSDMGAEAAKIALANSQIDPKDLDLIVVGTFTPDMLCPSAACLIQEKIGAVNAAAFDAAAACTGFIYGLSIAKQFVLTRVYKNILVIGAEKLSSVTDWTDRNTCVLFGDGAGAAIVGPDTKGHKIISEYLGADGSTAELLYVPAGGSRSPASSETVQQKLHFLKMNGREVFKNAVQSMTRSIEILLKKEGLTIDDIKWVIPHQANMRILTAIARHLDFSEDKIYINLDKYGNMSAASTAVGLDEIFRSSELEKGDRVLLVAFGSGFTWGSCLIEW